MLWVWFIFSYRGSVFPLMVKSLIIYVLFLSMLWVTLMQRVHFSLMLLLLLLSCNVILSFFNVIINVYPPPLLFTFYSVILVFIIWKSTSIEFYFLVFQFCKVIHCLTVFLVHALKNFSPPLSFMNVWHDYSIFSKIIHLVKHLFRMTLDFFCWWIFTYECCHVIR